MAATNSRNELLIANRTNTTDNEYLDKMRFSTNYKHKNCAAWSGGSMYNFRGCLLQEIHLLLNTAGLFCQRICSRRSYCCVKFFKSFAQTLQKQGSLHKQTNLIFFLCSKIFQRLNNYFKRQIFYKWIILPYKIFFIYFSK